jgi:hypothetical protein
MKEATMDNVINGATQAPKALIRVALAATDLAALPLLGVGFASVAGLAFAAVGLAAGGINFVLGLRFLDFFPVFPIAARILSGFSLFAFTALLIVSTLPLWQLYRTTWQRYWSWHSSAWTGVFLARFAGGGTTGHKERTRASVRRIRLAGLIFIGLFAATFALMMLLARGPFWHVWHWFV